MICSHAETVKNPVPDDAGCGITSVPLYSGFVKSSYDSGIGKFFFFNSSLFTAIPVINAVFPTHFSGCLSSLNCGRTRSAPFGEYPFNISFLSKANRLDAAVPHTTSACVFFPSASNFAVITPVESRTMFNFTSGYFFLKESR